MTYYVAGLPYSADDICHYGIKGQKWGIRRFQNPDGTRTQAGKIRYREDGSSNNSGNNHEKLKKAAKIAAVTAGTAALAYGTYRLAKSGALNDVAGKVSETARNAKMKFDTDRAIRKTNRSLDRGVRQAIKNQNAERRRENKRRMRDAINVNQMSDDELLRRIGRMQQEADFRRLVRESMDYTPNAADNVLRDAGKKVVGTFLAGAGTYAIKALLTKKFNPSDAADYVAPKPKKK